jgi:hypothetical protein
MDSSNLHVNDAATVTVTATDDTDTADTATTTSATIAIETKKKLLNDTTKTKTKNKRRQPKEIGSGVLVVKHLKKQKTKTNQIVDFSQVDFTKNKFTGIDKSIGMGGASSWD